MNFTDKFGLAIRQEWGVITINLQSNEWYIILAVMCQPKPVILVLKLLQHYYRVV